MRDHVLTPADVLPAEPPHAEAGIEIAVVGQLNLPEQTEETRGLLERFTAVALRTIHDEGARIRFVDVTDEVEPDYAAIRATDAVVVLGGGDVEASRYGHRGPVPNEYGVDTRSDERQLRVIREAIERDAAMLAICRGSQLLNVASGGTLVPDLDPSDLHRGAPGEPMFHDEEVLLEPGTRVAAIYPGRDRLTVRSGHHQAVAEVGAGLRVIARAHDGVIEGTERVDRRWIVGVQWHPEDSDGPADDRRAIFRAVVDEARRRRA